MAHASYHPGAVREKETGMRRHPHQPQPNESRLGGISVSTQSEFQRCPPISGAHFDREVLPPISRAHFVTETVPPMWRTLRPTQRALPRDERRTLRSRSVAPPTTPPNHICYHRVVRGTVVAPTMVAKNPQPQREDHANREDSISGAETPRKEPPGFNSESEVISHPGLGIPSHPSLGIPE